MKTVLETLSATRIRLLVDAPFEHLEPALRQACAEAAARVGGTGQPARIAGFHRGRLPFQPIDRRYGVAVLPQAVESEMLALALAAAQQETVTPLGRLDIEITGCDHGGPLRLAVLLEVRPRIILPDLSSIVVAVPPVTVEESSVDATLLGMREQLAASEPVDRPAANGDVVQFDLRARVEVEEMEELRAVDMVREIGSGGTLLGAGKALTAAGVADAVDQGLVGLRLGDSATVTIELGGGPTSGKQVDVEVTLTAVMQRRLPPLDDEFAAHVSPFATLEELRADVRERLLRSKEMERLYAVRTRVLQQIADVAAVPAPEGLVQDEVEHRRQWIEAELSRMGATLAEYLTVTGKPAEEIDAEILEATTLRVRSQLLLDALADVEELEVSTEEIGEVIARRAERMGVPVETYRSTVAGGDAGAALTKDVRRAKALAVVMQRVSMKDVEGRTLTVQDLRNGRK